ncbi:MAG TPA: HAD-IA family hydrolase [Terracidiphilus sp.]|nr:HAD-IA family hydrolase [Terracidiphilus sp.]
MASVGSSSVTLHCKGILFDMDGILISSIASVERSWTKWALMRDVDPADALRIAHGCRAIETVAKLRPDLDSESELKVIEEIEVADGEGVRVLPGVLDLLQSIPPARWTVVTSATERLARARMAGAGIAVPERIVTAEFVTYGKPHPEPFLAGAELLGAAPAECIVFEDSSSGVIAGRDAGCTVIATTFSHPAEALNAAHYMIPDLTGVKIQSPAEELILQLISPGVHSQSSPETMN